MNNGDIMTYLPNMQVIESDIMSKVIELRNSYNYDNYSAIEVENILKKDRINLDDFAVLLSPKAELYLEQMAVKAKKLTRANFGNTIALFTPLYIANYCENLCVYCGFNCLNKIKRAKLTEQEMQEEMISIAKTGLKELLILTGESRHASSVEYIGQAVKIAKKYFNTIGIEIYPLNVNEYKYLNELGVDFVSVYQETYDLDCYGSNHLSGSKRVFPYRFDAQERALLGGMRGVNFGALLGLDDFRKDAFSAGAHAYLVQKKYPYSDIGFSVPRIRPFINKEDNYSGVKDKQLLQVMLAYRLLMPFASITISTRENSKFRDNVIGLVATKISAGVSVGVGGHSAEEKGDEQFQISDERSVKEIIKAVEDKGLQSIFTDNSFLTKGI